MYVERRGRLTVLITKLINQSSPHFQAGDKTITRPSPRPVHMCAVEKAARNQTFERQSEGLGEGRSRDYFAVGEENLTVVNYSER